MRLYIVLLYGIRGSVPRKVQNPEGLNQISAGALQVQIIVGNVKDDNGSLCEQFGFKALVEISHILNKPRRATRCVLYVILEEA